MSAAPVATVEKLREQIRRLQAAPKRCDWVIPTGVQPFDALLPWGGVPRGQTLELWGEPASGRTSLSLRVLASATLAGRLCAFVDGASQLYPPAAAALGVNLQRLLIVRPRQRAQLCWATLQLCRSGAFAAVTLDLTQSDLRLSLPDAKKLSDAALQGQTALVLLTSPSRPADGMIRVRTEAVGVRGLRAELIRSRKGGLGQTALIPWDALYPGRPPVYRYQSASALTPSAPTPSPLSSFYRIKPSWERNGDTLAGCYGIRGGRSGRDTTLPPLNESLGLGGEP